jgi:hypothetical protein
LAQTISITSSGAAANVTVSSSGAQWLIVTPTGQQTTPTQITVNVQPAGLTPGTYAGNIQIVTAGGAANGTVNVPVTLLVSSNPIIAANPASLTFTAQVGTSAPTQNLSLVSSGSALSYTVTSSVGSPPGGNWLQVPNQSGATPGAVSVSVNTAGLAVGTYLGAINVTSPNAGNGNLSVPVTLNITAGPALQLSAPSLAFAFQTGQAQPLSQTVGVASTSGQVSYTVGVQTSTGQQWLAASPANGVAPGNFVVSVNTTGLTAGTYNGTISVTPSGASSIPQTIPVTLVVSSTALLVVSPSNLTFSATAGSAVSSFQTVAVTSTDGTNLAFSVAISTSTGLSWLLVNTSSATTPSNLSVSANPSGLSVGTYTGTVTITSTSAGVTNSPQLVHVTLNVTSANTLNVSSSSLAFSQTTNGTPPAPQTVNVTSSGASIGAQITFSASVALNQGQNWLTVSPLNATTPAALTVTANGAGLAAGTYTGQITLSSPGVAQQTINVTLTVGSGGGTGLSFAGSMAQIASAGLWKTTITIVNNGATSAQVHINFFDDNGNPLSLPLTFPQTSAVPQPPAPSLDRTLNAGATLLVETTGPDSQTTQVGWAQVLTNGNVGVFAVFRQTVNGLIPEGVVPLETRNAGSYLLAFDNTAGYLTGVALANINTQAATIGVVIRDDAGAILQSGTVTVPALGHTSFSLSLNYPIAAQRRGTVEFQTPAGGQISVLGLRFSPTTAFTTIPPLAK